MTCKRGTDELADARYWNVRLLLVLLAAALVAIRDEWPLRSTAGPLIAGRHFRLLSLDA